jgi:tetratricopeptide (TPR) repeat protein
MTREEAEKIIRESVIDGDLSESDKFIVTEALDFMIRETYSQKYIVYLGEIYYKDKQYDLARKYFEMAVPIKSMAANEYLGLMWDEGTAGHIDYEKAYYYYNTAMELGSFLGLYKLADMYRYGHYVEEDYEQYCEMIEGSYRVLKNTDLLSEPLAEIEVRLAEIRLDEEDPDEAFELLMDAKDIYAERLMHDMYLDDLEKMKEAVYLLYSLIDIEDMDLEVFELYDMFEILRKPCRLFFTFNGGRHWVESAIENDTMAINLEGKWYRSIIDFMTNARIDSKKLLTMPYEFYNAEIQY